MLDILNWKSEEKKPPDPQEVERRDTRNAIIQEKDPFKVAEMLCKYDPKEWTSMIYGARTETAIRADGSINFTVSSPRLNAVTVDSEYCKTLKK